MRSSILPKRPLRRVRDACMRQQHNHTISTFSRTAATATTIPSRNLRQTARSTLSACRPPSNRTAPQARYISSSASPSPESAPSPPHKEPPPPAKTHYDLFPQTLPAGPPPQGPFAIDTRALRREFLTLQATAHPDLAPAGAPRRAAEAVSARINDAYRTLAHPLLRAQYLLSLRGIDAAGEETGRVEDPELLMLVLETREAIEEAEEERDLEGLRMENEVRIRESEGVLARAFGEDDVDVVRAEVTRLRYWVNIAESIHNWERGKPVVLQH
ncbi:Co-chaperone Hsc20 [Hypoxylon crocopeplum]|nr:Co-chaperone Hsc20 [Hypoxylon crocopeplum]